MHLINRQQSFAAFFIALNTLDCSVFRMPAFCVSRGAGRALSRSGPLPTLQPLSLRARRDALVKAWQLPPQSSCFRDGIRYYVFNLLDKILDGGTLVRLTSNLSNYASACMPNLKKP